jgi:copper chaperone CopZ
MSPGRILKNSTLALPFVRSPSKHERKRLIPCVFLSHLDCGHATASLDQARDKPGANGLFQQSANASLVGARLILCGLLFAAGAANAAGLTRVDQIIFGMDCAPCAYGVEQGLKKLPGVTAVMVSLNQGKAVIELAPDNVTELAQIQEIIRHNGFTPKEAVIVITGALEQRADGPVLVIDDTRHALATQDTELAAQLQALPGGAMVVLEAVVAAGMATDGELTVRRILLPD